MTTLQPMRKPSLKGAICPLHRGKIRQCGYYGSHFTYRKVQIAVRSDMSEGKPSEESDKEDRISQTLADLDALLGITEEKEEMNKEVKEESKAVIDVSPSVIKAIAEAEAERAKSAGTSEDDVSKNVNDSIVSDIFGCHYGNCNVV